MALSAELAESMVRRRIVELRRGLLPWPLVRSTRATARRASVSSTEMSENRILGSNAYSHCQPIAVENREAIRTTSMMDDCNARALTPMRKSSIAVLSSRLFSELSPSARMSKGFLIVGTKDTTRNSCSTRTGHWSDVLGESTELLSLLDNTRFKSRRQF